MQVVKLKEAGYEEALLGLSLSFYDHQVPLVNWEDDGLGMGDWCYDFTSTLEAMRYSQREPNEYFWTDARFDKAKKIALHLATKQPPEDYEVRNNLAYINAEQKFLEQIDVWLYIQASRDFWSEFDTYRVDMSKQSSSTMHTLSKRQVTVADFEAGTKMQAIACLNVAIDEYSNTKSEHYHDVSRLKKNLPEGWLQERVIKTSYKTLKWILEQRDGHRLESWEFFYQEVFKQIDHPEFITPYKAEL